MAKKRLDVMLTEQNLVSSRERAKTTIMAGLDRKSTRLNSSHANESRMPSSA